MKHKKVLLIGIYLIFVYFFIDYKLSEIVAVKYMQVLSIKDSISYESVKREIKDISPQTTQKYLFSDEFEDLEGTIRGFRYKIDDVRLEGIEGLGEYKIKIKYRVEGYKDIQSITEVKGRKVLKVYRVDN